MTDSPDPNDQLCWQALSAAEQSACVQPLQCWMQMSGRAIDMIWRRPLQLVRLLRDLNWEGFWRRYERAVDHMDWAWNSVMLYFTAFVVIPPLVLAIIAQAALGPAPTTPMGPQGTMERLVSVLLWGVPIWQAVASYARFSAASPARRIQSWIDWIFSKIIWTNVALMTLFGLLRIIV